MDEDWRLGGQEGYLKGATLVRRAYRPHPDNPDWDHDHGTPRKYIRMSGSVDGGGNTGRNTTIISSNYLQDPSAAIYEKSRSLYETLSQDLNYNVMFSQRGVLNLCHSDAQRDVFARRGNAMLMMGADAELLDRQQQRGLGGIPQIPVVTAAGVVAQRSNRNEPLADLGVRIDLVDVARPVLALEVVQRPEQEPAFLLELTDLLDTTTGTGVGHQIDGVDVTTAATVVVLHG